MRVIILALLAVAAVAVYDPTAPTGPEIIPNEWIVVLKPQAQMRSHLAVFASSVNATNVMHTYSIGDFQGYAVQGVSTVDILKIAAHEDVKYVEPNMVARTLQTCNTYAAPHSWGLARTVIQGPVPAQPPIAQQPYQMLTGADGRGVEVHVIDTGIYCENEDFAVGQCSLGADFTGQGAGDGNGHGTHVASTSVGQRFGIAKAATTRAVKVLGANGSGTFANVIAGINWSANQARSRPGTRVVGNMSLGGGLNQPVNDATNASFQAGLVMVVAAGNSNNNACNSSPASATLAYTVMSTDTTDGRSTFSSFGNCCQIFAPGTGITAAWIGAPTRTNTISGTSMAAPHIAGIAAKIWSAYPTNTNAQVQSALTAAAQTGLIRNPGANSPNLMGLWNCATR